MVRSKTYEESIPASASLAVVAICSWCAGRAFDLFPNGGSAASSGSIVSSSCVVILMVGRKPALPNKTCPNTNRRPVMNSYNHSSALTDEYTPLLDRVNDAQSLPAISPVLARISVSSDQEIPSNDLLPYSLNDQPTEMAFILAVLLQLRHGKMQSFKSASAYERWFRRNLDTDGLRTLEIQIIRVWTEFLEQYRDVREIETVLWTQFPLEIGGIKTIRGLSITLPVLCSIIRHVAVADFLGSFPALASHPVLTLSLSHTWCHGVPTRPPSESLPAANSSISWIRRYDALCTPR